MINIEDYKYKAFISYSHKDEKWASWLHKALETYSVPKHLVGQSTAYGPVPARIAPIFRDREELSTATNLGDVLTA
ncbi:MAG: toll/interleukin-1 receptor domain-containing protein, partial [Woeseiaceae bacterium]|nr:toll/interleukin-1 receptor domain-containing protein [Woeseiaceae bacterium]